MCYTTFIGTQCFNMDGDNSVASLKADSALFYTIHGLEVKTSAIVPSPIAVISMEVMHILSYMIYQHQLSWFQSSQFTFVIGLTFSHLPAFKDIIRRIKSVKGKGMCVK